MNTTLVARGGTLARTPITYDQALATLGRDGRVRCGDGWMVRCPAHEDSVPSLKIAQSSSGNLLMHCKAGCSFQEVLDALKDRAGSDPTKSSPLPPSRETPSAMRSGSRQSHEDPWAWWVEKTGIPREWWEENGVNVRKGNIAFRFEQPGREVWKVRTPGGQGKYRWEPAGSDCPKPSLWPVPEGELREIIVSEGETDCAILRYLGFTNAYANTKGAGFDISETMLCLRDVGLRSVTVLYDLDKTGIPEAERCTMRLRRLGIPAKQAVLPLPFGAMLRGLKDVNDLWHWVRHSRAHILSLIAPTCGQSASPGSYT